MLQKPNNYEDIQTYSERAKLAPGGYVLKILGTKQEEYQKGKQLVLRFDIAEGENADFYAADFRSQKENDQIKEKKWRGTYRFWLPRYDGSEQDEWAFKRLKTVITCIEESNGFQYNWNAEEGPQLTGKLVGGVFNRKEYDFQGKTGFFTQCKFLTVADAIREGRFTVPEDDLLKKEDAAPEGYTALRDDDIPF